FNVGHGDCFLVSKKNREFLLVDCGARFPGNHPSIPLVVEMILHGSTPSHLVVSHYHYDHFSLLPEFALPSRILEKWYVPEIPHLGPGRQLGRAVMQFLMAATISRFERYWILAWLSRILGPPKALRKDMTIRGGGLSFDVLWPDLGSAILGTDHIKRKAKNIHEILENILRRLDLPIPDRDVPDDMSATELFFESLPGIFARANELDDEQISWIHERLTELKDDFGFLADRLSIAMETSRWSRSRILFLGDLPQRILDFLEGDLKYSSYGCIKAAHHGTEFGAALRDLSTDYLLVSRSTREFPPLKPVHHRYHDTLRYRDILTTEIHGSCFIG
ncbi:MAG: MBL fold metallo-hydrolase, partial [Thermoplasmata archaeon]